MRKRIVESSRSSSSKVLRGVGEEMGEKEKKGR